MEAIHGEYFTVHEQLQHIVFEYIEVDYNRQRRHSRIDYVPLIVFEEKYAKLT